MHELSIAMSIVEMAEEEASHRNARVNAVHLKLGMLSGVVKAALLSSYELACEGTELEGSPLVIEEIPVVVYCPQMPRAPCAGFRPMVHLPRMQEPCIPGDSGPRTSSRRVGDTGMSPQTRLVEIRQNVLKHNDVVAPEPRQRFHDAGVYVVSLVSSPGSGKTAFLEKTLGLLRPGYRVAALVGDLATENDAVRLARSHEPARQIPTGNLCHLEAAMVPPAPEGWDLDQLDFL